ncbi:MAG: AAA family ATPase [Anaerolineae bacterium]|nr:AAA family ATPase [Anaerolineae bacterium]
MIRRVRVRGYKSLADVSIELNPLTVIFGPNAAGKSNLFDALALLARTATHKTLRDAFEEHRGAPAEAFFRDGSGVDAMLDEGTARFTIEVDVQLSGEVVDTVERRIRLMVQDGSPGDGPDKGFRKRIQETLLCYSLTVEIAPSTGFLRVADERLVALNQDLQPSERRKPFIERIDHKLRLRLEGQARPTDYDVGLDYTLLSQPVYPPHYPHIAALKEELSRWRFYYLEPSAMRREVPPGEVLSLRRDGADLAAFIKTLEARNRPQFEALIRSLSMLLPNVDELRLEQTRAGLLQLNVIEQGAAFPAHLISEGTLRVLGLLAITSPASESTVVGYEEPENGVHPRRLRLIAELLRNAAAEGMQLLVNTHSPILPTYFEDDSLVVCRRRDRRSEFLPFRSFAPLFRQREIDQALDETPLSERIIRGDFDD